MGKGVLKKQNHGYSHYKRATLKFNRVLKGKNHGYSNYKRATLKSNRARFFEMWLTLTMYVSTL